jgi:hypothetical protein
MMRLKSLLWALLLCFGGLPVRAQDAHPADHGSVDAIVGALYASISGPAGQRRDEARFLDLFLPDAQLCAQVLDSAGRPRMVYRQLQPFIQGIQAYTAQNSFFETERARRTEEWGGLVHVWSTYESRHAPGEEPFARGINSIQLFHDGSRWWVANVSWTDESTGTPLPKHYFKGKR